MKKYLALAGLLTLSITAPALAQEGPKMSYSLSAASDYMWRGVSQTDSNPAVFAAASGTVGNFYFGAGAENVDFAGINTEYDLWAGYNVKLSNATTLDLGLVRYGYVDAPTDIDTLEVKAALNHSYAKGNVGILAMHTSDYFGSGDAATYYEVNGSYPLSDKVSLSAAYGYQALDNSTGDYATYNIGLGYAVNSKVSLDLRYHSNDIDSAASVYDSKLVASVKVAF